VKKYVSLKLLRGYLFYKVQIRTLSPANIFLIIIIIHVVSVIVLIEAGSDDTSQYTSYEKSRFYL
jgi:hypothetical protein